ncbi:nucleoside-diphosphate sugar epimerase [Cellvibrio zantedeschiae]|uniref:Nucleoside-diphosphate sugar epimerase n=1 Tax=Cellvibrio zantedeschiae TaxID=1237077 RepID=A0ABQ3AZH4_9GAMM|nr:nucleoside-diphosphate sugar epimerase/dehydratase [Cellvibrio zantedeschiae]GGY72721.1 nucleoside-diphosphate sugar epimerase [Cellvibrio zantedeschiae]
MNSLLAKFLNAPRPIKRAISVAYDVVAISVAFYLAYVLRLSQLEFHFSLQELLCLVATIVISIALFVRMGLYRAILRYIPPQAIVTILIGIVASSFAMIATGFYLHAFLPRSVPVIYSFIALFLIGLPRLMFRSLLQFFTPKGNANVIIYGAGESGHYLASQLNKSVQYKPVAFVDDNEKLHQSNLRGIKVYSPTELPHLVKKFNAKKILLALDTANQQQTINIVRALEKLPVQIQAIPPLNDLINGTAHIEEFRSIQIEELLGREPVAPAASLLEVNITNKVVMVTGAGGSIGSEICRQVIALKPAAIVLFERCEFNLYQINDELLSLGADNSIKIYPILGSINNEALLENIMKSFHVETLYHAAAYKHVPLVEYNILEGTNNNLFGTLKTAKAAIAAKVEHFVLISSDKAVRPTNVMGATKRLAELVLQALATQNHSTIFSMVRFGNVLDSSGSVVPKFREQIKRGGPITVTHPEITRYFMTMSEAAQLVIQAGAMAQGGDVFVLEMGEPVKIVNLATEMAFLSGYSIKSEANPDGDIEIKFTGLRPGEKLYEELLVGENCEGTEHARILRANEKSIPLPELETYLGVLQSHIEKFNHNALFNALKQPFVEFNAADNTEDLLHYVRTNNVVQLKTNKHHK